MKYAPPYGEGPDAPYSDGNLSAGIRGSVPPAAAIEDPQREIVHVIAFAGLTPDDSDMQQLRKAIAQMISAATGGGDVSQFLLVSQARARLPIFPEIQTVDGRMNVSSPGAGSVLVPATVAFQHRGIYPLNTSDYSEPNRTFATVANKTYHLRWTPTGGFALKDVADATYNPSGVPEADARFDSTYDDMLVARVVTSAGNVATITNLANKHDLSVNAVVTGTNLRGAGANTANCDLVHVYNLARTPKNKSVTVVDYFDQDGTTGSTDVDILMQALGSVPNSNNPALIPTDRYRLAAIYMRDGMTRLRVDFSARA